MPDALPHASKFLEFKGQELDAPGGAMGGWTAFMLQIRTAGGSRKVFLTNAIFGRSGGRNHDGAIFDPIDKNPAKLGLEDNVGIRRIFGRLTGAGCLRGPKARDVLGRSQTRGKNQNCQKIC